MKRLLALLGMSVGGWIGWEVGSPVSFFVAFLVSVVGAGAGLYAAREFVDRYRP